MNDLILAILIWASTLLMPVVAWCQSAAISSKITDPLWIALTLLGIVFGFLQWSLTRNINGVDNSVKQLRESDEKLEATLRQEIRDLRTEVHELRTESRCQRDKLIKVMAEYETCPTCNIHNRRTGDAK